MKINIPLQLTFFLYTIKDNNFLIFKNTKDSTFFYLKCPNHTKTLKKNQTLTFASKNWNFHFFNFIQILFFKIKKLSQKQDTKLFHKKLILKGLGFKILRIFQNDFIELKLGFSHFIKIIIPSKNNLTLYTNKNMIIIEGKQKDLVGSFANKIKSYRVPDSYKGKGIWYKGESKLLKEVKKT